MVSQDVPRNQSQQISKSFGVNLRETSPTVLYTCPAGKKATVKGSALVDSTGAAGTVDLVIAGQSIAEWQATGGGTDPNVPQNLAINTRFQFDVQLNSGETISYTQNTGSNASMTFSISVQESNA